MATVFFTKDGHSPECVHFVDELFTSDAVHHFGAYERNYSPDMPTIGTSTHLTDYSGYKHIIVRINEDEVCPAFPKSGYYTIKDLTVSAARSMMGVEKNREGTS